MAAGRDAAQAGAEAVELAAGAEAGASRQQGKGRDDCAQRRSEGRRAEPPGERRRREEGRADRVGETGRARVLQRALAEARLEEGEVGETGEAEPSPEGEA